MNKYLLLHLIFLPSIFSQSNLSCNTTLGSTRRIGPPCVLPYRLNGEIKFECTTSFRPSGHSLPRNLIGRPLCPITGVSPLTLNAPLSPQSWAPCSSSCLLVDYRTNQELWKDLDELASTFPRISSTFVLGPSLQGRPLMGINIGIRSQLRPRIRFYSGLAGDQATGRELLAHMAMYLLYSYGKNQRITNILDSTQISILPAANPDGFLKAHKGSCSGTRRREGERNAADVSLETDFPTASEWYRFQSDLDYDPFLGRQPETESLMNWSVDEPWVLGLHLQDGMVAVTYPFHGKEGESAGPHLAPDTVELHHLAKKIVRGQGQDEGKHCYYRTDGGVANGAEFQAKHKGKRGGGLGSVEDFSYMFTPSLELRLGVSCCKFPVRYALTREWERQKESLLLFMEEAQRGVKGVVYLPNNSPAVGADILLWGPQGGLYGRNGSSSLQGEFFRYLIPDSRHYTIQAVLDDCEQSGKRYSSPRLQILITDRRPLITQLVFLRQSSFCQPQSQPSNLADQFRIFGRGSNGL